MSAIELRTDRLLLRKWRAADRAEFARLNADPVVTEFLGGPMSPTASNAMADRIDAHLQDYGFGLWAVEIEGVAEFTGFIGLSRTPFQLGSRNVVEVSWRLAAAHWGRGYATEGARAALEFGFFTLKLPEIVSFTVPGNLRSRRVMEKLGMSRDPEEDFDHPRLSTEHPLCRHVLYRKRRPDE